MLNIVFNILAVVLWLELIDKEDNRAIKLILNADYSRINLFRYGLDEKSYLQVEDDFKNLFSLNNELYELSDSI